MTTREAVEILAYQPDFIDELIPMWRESFEEGVGIVDWHPIEEQRQFFLTEVVPDNEVRVALLASEIVGFVAATRESVSQLYMRHGFPRAGLGTRLLDWAKAQSRGQLWLYTSGATSARPRSMNTAASRQSNVASKRAGSSPT